MLADGLDCRPEYQYHIGGGFESIIRVGKNMRSNPMVKAGIVVLLLAALVAGVVLWLSNASISPPVKTITQTIPDDHIPR